MAHHISYYRVMSGKGSEHAKECYEGEFIGVYCDGFDSDLSNDLSKGLSEFSSQFKVAYRAKNPEANAWQAGKSCGTLWTICEGIRPGDIVLCSSGERSYWVGEIVSGYVFVGGSFFPHQRKVKWLETVINRDVMSESLQRSTSSAGTVAEITQYADEIESFIGRGNPPTPTPKGEESVSGFALEKHLEDFLVENWSSIDLGERYHIYEEEGKLAGQQLQTPIGIIDILAISKDKKELLVVELKKGHSSDIALGQVLRYMGYVKENLADNDQAVRGVIIASESDLRLEYALKVTHNVEFYRYEVNFQLKSKPSI